jgi:hypothetical protein
MDRMRSWTLLIGTLCLLCALLPPAFAGDPPVPIEGRLLVSGHLEAGIFAYFMEGDSATITLAPEQFQHGSVSPEGDQVAYHAANEWGPGGYDPWSADMWTADVDGSNAANLTELAGLGGINCFPSWSPDGSLLAFHHCDPQEGLRPCEAGFHVWVIESDATGARPVFTHPGVRTFQPSWSPNGYRLLCLMEGVGAVTVDTDGTDLELLPNVYGAGAAWSRDGSQIASTWSADDVVGGEPGTWRQLIVTDAHGGNPQVLVEQFVKDADIDYHIDLHGFDLEARDWFGDVVWWSGPLYPQWSPLGDRIVFLAALPFDPGGAVDYRFQVEAWMYDLETHDLTQITDDSDFNIWLSWHGPNTFPEDPQVTVDDVTVTFSEVIGEGVTTILRDDDPPDVPTGFFFDYEFYELHTTAEITGPISICMTYTDEEVPPAAEADLAILHWDGAEWVDITTSRDPVNNIICAETDTLSPIALHGIRITKFPDVPAWGFGTDGLDPHWAYYQVMACVEARIVSGYEDGSYQPTGPVPRDQMAVFISRAMAGGDENVPAGPETATFNDVPTDYWAYDYVEYCVANDVVQGYDAVTYGPTDLVNRGSMAVFISRADAGGDAGVPDGPTEATFDDVPTDYWCYKYIEYCVAENIVQGYSPTTYGPTGLVTRDQMAVFITRAFGLAM